MRRPLKPPSPFAPLRLSLSLCKILQVRAEIAWESLFVIVRDISSQLWRGLKETGPSFAVTLNECVCVSVHVCVCVRECPKDPLRRRHRCVFFCLEPRGRLLKSSLSCATNILATALRQQQDVFPERKRGWEEGPNVDLFPLLSFLFWLPRSCRSVGSELFFFLS